jgi:hypothetical protein
MGARRQVKTSRELIESCGVKIKVSIWEVTGMTVQRYHGEFIYDCKYSEACAFVKSGFEWRWVNGMGLQVYLCGESALGDLLEGFRRLAGGWMNNGADGFICDRKTKPREWERAERRKRPTHSP